MHPFIFPAMGSHGAATAEGQAMVLDHYKINEGTMGCPVISQLDVVDLGATEEGLLHAFMDKQAFECDGVMLIGRVKWHTDFAGKIESGLFKMMAIGLGKFAGAQHYHTYAHKIGLERVIRLSYRLLGLISFLTAGPDEVRAWPIPGGSTAVDAAGTIHTDLAKGFIRAETVGYDDLVRLGSTAEARKVGRLRSEGKTYIWRASLDEG